MSFAAHQSQSTFIGRTDELDRIGALLRSDDVPLVTLSGPGGVGKTRLALQLLSDLKSDFSDGVHLVELSALRDSELVLPAIANTLNLRDSRAGSTSEKLVEYFRPRKSLLMLDNLEHVVQSGADVAELLNECPALKILSTSRIALRLSLEYTIPVQPLDMPSAVQLFVERARSVSASFRLTAENQRLILEICRRLDGLPLAIELAAARIQSMPLRAMVERLDHALPLLTGGDARQPDRLRTMRDAIAWSYELLEPGEQILFRRLSIFAAGIDPGRIPSVTGIDEEELDSLDGVAALVEKSLLQPLDVRGGRAPRYRMLETIREFGLELLALHGEETIAQFGFASHFAELAARTSLGQYSAAFAQTLNALDVEHDNAIAVLEWAIAAGALELGVEMAAAMGPYWIFRGHYRDGRAWIARFLDLVEPEPSQARARALVRAGWLANLHGDVAGADGLLASGIDCAQLSGEDNMVAQGRIAMSLVKLQQRDYPAASFNAQESYILYRALEPGNPNFEYWASMSLTILGQIASLEGDVEAAPEYSARALEQLGKLPSAWALGASIRVLGDLAHDAGDTSWARAYYQEGIKLAVERADYRLAAEVISGMASLAFKAGDAERSARWYGAVHGLRKRESITEGWDRGEHDRRIALVRSTLDPPAFESAWAAGESTAIAEIVRDMAEYSGGTDSETTSASTSVGDALASLTERERAVLRLVARGLSNVQIGAELGISKRTAGVHIGNILAKLELDSRTQAAALALREGIV